MTKHYVVYAHKPNGDLMCTRTIDGGSMEDAVYIAADSMQWKEINNITVQTLHNGAWYKFDRKAILDIILTRKTI